MRQADFVDAQTAYEGGNLEKALQVLRGLGNEASPSSRLLEAVVMFDQGDAEASLNLFDQLCDAAADASLEQRFQFESGRFSRSAPFFTPHRTTSQLAKVRQLATALGQPPAIAGLHLAVAKLEALRGSVDDARLHLDIARKIATARSLLEVARPISLIEAIVDTALGNVGRAMDANAKALEVARRKNSAVPLVGLLANAGQLSLWNGGTTAARRLLVDAQLVGPQFRFLQLGIADTLAALEIFEGNLPAAATYLKSCQDLIASHRVPARSWYDLTHQITRCLYLSLRDDWQAIIDIVNEADPELERRQLRTWRSALLAARARAEARLGLHDAADASLLAAMRTCPRGAVDPMISIETATGTCLALRGDTQQAHRHFDRARRACDAIGHRFHAWVVDHERQSLPVLRHTEPLAPADQRRPTDTVAAALLLADVSSILNAGQSLELLAQRVMSVLESTPLRSRLDVTRTTATDEGAAPSAAWEFRGSQGCRIDLTGGDARISINIRHLASLEEISFVKSLTDIIGAAVHLDDDADNHLWPTADSTGVDDTVFWSPRMQELLRVAQRLASTDLPVLITGETGTGKEVFARLIHEHSRVKRGPFIPFNASAIPRDLVESQMFGHRRGAFTGALESSPGVIRSADQGTLFLDEIGDLDPIVQPKFLRFLESGEVHPVGDTRPLHVKVRVVAATNARLEDLVSQGRFRSDLLYRLRVATLALPPLRERKDEIPALTAHFVRKAVAETGRARLTIGDDLVAAFLLYDWPGNLRQLANELRRVAALAEDGAVLRSSDLSPEVSGPWFAARPQTEAPAPPGGVTIALDQPLELALAETERIFIERALAQTHGHVSGAAQLLGISRKGLFLKRKKLGLD
jgi:DNA-binding NtrC family response regulator